MKIYEKLLFLGAMAMLVAGGCNSLPAPPADLPESSEPMPLVSSEQAQPPAVSTQPSQQDPQTIPTPLAERLHEPQVYRYNLETGLYEQYPLTLQQDATTVADLVFAAADRLNLTVRLNEISQQKGMIVVDFAKEASPAVGLGSSGERAALDSIAMTILQNHLSAEWICYRVDGGAYESGHFLLGIDEPYQPTPLKLVENTPDEYTKIRTKIPFPGLPPAGDWAQLPIETDALGEELAWALTLIGAPAKEVASPEELDNDFMIQQALDAAPSLNCIEAFRDVSDPSFQPALKPIAAMVQDGEMTLREHVEEAARLLYGDTVKLRHRSVMGEKWKWHETQGVYTPPHMGTSRWLCAVLEYEQVTSKRYRVKCAFVRMGMGGMADDNGDLITEAEFNNAIQTRVRQREMVVQRNDDDGFMLISHRFL